MQNRINEIKARCEAAKEYSQGLPNTRIIPKLKQDIQHLLSEIERLTAELEAEKKRADEAIIAYRRCDKLLCEKMNRLDDALAELEAYKQAEGDGLIVKLPVPLGTKLYEVLWDGTVIWTNFRCSDIEEYGRTLFLTEAEAKKHMEV